MKIAIVYNRDSKRVINLFGIPNQEKIGRKTIDRISDGLRKGGHLVRTFEGDKDLVANLEHFMPRVLKGELPGLVFNLSYGIQGQARYTHVPSILEMVGIPYVGSGPLAHSLALDKVVAKMIFQQHGVPTPQFFVMDSPDAELPDMKFPMIVKPKNEAVSFGIRIVKNEAELRDGAGAIFKKYDQPVLVEQYIAGREINVGLLGNNPPDTLPPVELKFGRTGQKIYTYEDKTRRSGREIGWECPAKLPDKVMARAQEIARRAFSALGCCDCARVDMRMDSKGNLYVLEINSLPSMGEHGSYTIAAKQAGLDFDALVCRLVDVAAARYFGTPAPPDISKPTRDVGQRIFSYLVERRDELEDRVRDWTMHTSRTDDPTGLHAAQERLTRFFDEMSMSPVKDLTDSRVAWTWQTKAGLDNGTLLIGHLDVPMESNQPVHAFRRDPEWLYGEGVGSSRAPLVTMQFALRALRSIRRLRKIPLGVLYYSDEGRDARYSHETIENAVERAARVLVLRPGNLEHHIINQRRGWRKYRLTVSGNPRRLGQVYKRTPTLQWATACMDRFTALTSREIRLAVACTDVKSSAFPGLLPHRVTALVLVSYLDRKTADACEDAMREILKSGDRPWSLEILADRPPMKKSRRNERLIRDLKAVAGAWDIALEHESSLYASAGGLVPTRIPVVCGVGPVARDLMTPQESVLRLSLMQRTLLLAQFLSRYAGNAKR